MATIRFGSLRKQFDLPAPKSGMDARSLGRNDTMEFPSGGAFVSTSEATHRVFDMAWATTPAEQLQPLFDFRNGVYGSNMLYFCDPFVRNALPPHWAEPGLTTDEWPSLVSAGVRPTAVAPATVYNHVRAPMPSVAGWTTSDIATGTITILTDALGEPYARMDRVLATSLAGRVNYQGITLPATPVIPTIQVRGNNSTGTIILAIRKGISTTNLSTVTINSNTLTGQWQTLTGTPYTPVGGADYSLQVISSAGTVGQYFEIRRAGILTSTSGLTYFNGDSRYVDGRTVGWAGAVNDSPSTMGFAGSDTPEKSAQYSLSNPLPTVGLPPRSAVLLIPPTKTLWLGFSGTFTAGAGVYVRGVTSDGSVGVPQRLTLLDPLGTVRLNTSFRGSDYAAVVIYIDTTTVGTSTITLNSGTATYADTGVTPTLTGVHTPGEGHTGLKFSGDIAHTYVQTRLTLSGQVRLITAAATLTEMGAWV